MRSLVYARIVATEREFGRCAIWARVSTDDQETAAQLAELRSWAERRSFEVAAEYVLDGASAWTGKHREQLRQALNDARVGRYDVLLVWVLDRLSREGIEATLSAMRADRGVAVWSLRESWTETSDPHVREPSLPSWRGSRRWNPSAAQSAPGPGSPAVRRRASRWAVSRARRTPGRASGPGMWRGGNASAKPLGRIPGPESCTA